MHEQREAAKVRGEWWAKGNDHDEYEDSDSDGDDDGDDGDDDGHGDGVGGLETCPYIKMCTSRVAGAARWKVKNEENESVRDTQRT